MSLKSCIAEFIPHICTFLGPVDIASLRLVSRDLCAKANAAFASASFEVVETDLSAESIKVLDAIARHHEFRLCVRTVRILRRSTSEYVHRPLNLTARHRPPKATAALDFCEPNVVASIYDTWRRFDNCCAFEICDSPGVFDDDNVLALGLSPANVIRLVTSALASDVRSPVALRVYIQREVQHKEASPVQLSSLTTVTSGMSSIRDLTILWSIEANDTALAVKLVKDAPFLERLHLNFVSSLHADLVMAGLANAPFLPPIQQLRIGSMHLATGKHLAAVLIHLRHLLCELHIGAVHLHKNDWSWLFRKLSQNDFPFLKRIAVCAIRAPDAAGGSTAANLYFCPLRLDQRLLESCAGAFEFMLSPCRGKMRVGGIRFTGQGASMKLALDALASESSYYLLCRSSRLPSPGHPNMRTFAEARVGRLVPSFVHVKIWDGVHT
ncbi:hypothetical protein DCS_05148 [Drechmeria coniospora]|uniref:F-box domain-containing protein n=1 Tax=Drechmeria coniospora TaxID=98403 RepID=A0A151GLZ6_DRECN|nr:hypothetical protein DCS_05148 [Drechmeria coniospora]KYK58135.1 hypothetical protein DCS_05148 [Drechmeria coniospora]ODA83026.1 hypothetical protein RJ55_01535 [Drechmeria coniospora]